MNQAATHTNLQWVCRRDVFDVHRAHLARDIGTNFVNAALSNLQGGRPRNLAAPIAREVVAAAQDVPRLPQIVALGNSGAHYAHVQPKTLLDAFVNFARR